MKTFKDLVPLDEYEQHSFAIESATFEVNFYKEVYHKRLNQFVNILIDRYKDSTVKIEYEIEHLSVIGAVMNFTFILSRYIHEYDKENFILSTTSISVKQSQQFDYFPHPYNEQEIEQLLLKSIDKLNKIKYE